MSHVVSNYFDPCCVTCDPQIIIMYAYLAFICSTEVHRQTCTHVVQNCWLYVAADTVSYRCNSDRSDDASRDDCSSNAGSLLRMYPVLRGSLCGLLHRPHYGSCWSVRLSVRLSVPDRLLFRNQDSAKENQIGVNVPIFSPKKSNIKVITAH